MRIIKILGTGCARCKQMEAIVRGSIDELGIEATVEKVEDIEKIMEYDVLSTPALVVDGEIVIRGKVPTMEEVRALLV